LWGFPTAAYGMIFYSLLLILALWLYFQASDKNEEKVSHGSLLIFILNIIALVPTLALAIISITKIHSLCLMCLGTYLINLALFVLSFKLFLCTKASTKRTFLNALRHLNPVNWLVLSGTAAIHLIIPTMINDSLSDGVKM